MRNTQSIESKKKSLNFSIGDDFGSLLTTIAQEHLMYNFNPEKALNTIKKSLIGCTEEQALKILFGDNILSVENGIVLMSSKDPDTPSSVDFVHWSETTVSDLQRHATRIGNYIKALKISSFSLTLDIQSIYNHSEGNSLPLLREVEESENISKMLFYLKSAKQLLKDTIEADFTIQWIQKVYPSKISKTLGAIDEVNIIKLKRILDDYLNGVINLEDDTLNTYLSNQRQIDEKISKGILPCDILDNYAAGWLSPEGVYYGLNGEIENLLHTQLADYLYNIGIIPNENDVDKDSWLEKNGWIRQHNNWILYSGYNYEAYDLSPIVSMTQTQKDLLSNFGHVCHKGVLLVGLQRKPISSLGLKRYSDIKTREIFQL